MQHRTFLRRHPVFTCEELAAHLASRGKAGPRTGETLLAYYTRIGRVVRIRRCLYASLPDGVDPDSHPVSPYLVAARLTADAVLSHHTALEYHGRAHSVWQHFVYSAARPAKPLVFRSLLFRGTKFPAGLLRTGMLHLETQEVDERGLPIRVTSLERTLVDSLHRPDLAGGWEEVWRSLESVEFFDLDAVLEYALLLDNATTTAKVGFYLDQHREALMVDDRHLNELRCRRPQQPHYMERSRRPSRMVSDWNLIVPEDVLTRSWNEVR